MHCNGCARKVEKHISKMEGMSKCPIPSLLYIQTGFVTHRSRMLMCLFSVVSNKFLVFRIFTITGVTSYKVDLESKMVVVIGDVLPDEVVQSVSKVKNAEIWNSP